MKILLAFDSFKECMTSFEAINCIKDKLHHICIPMPISDGGEGTMDVLVHSLNGSVIYTDIKGVFLKDINSQFAIIGNTAIIESAKAIGMNLCNGIKDPYKTSTYGLGELILKALDYNVNKIIITLGGSATNDGGIGMLNALGVRFYNKNHSSLMMMNDLKDIVSVDSSGIDTRLKDVEVIGLCDVVNPLCGENGATYVYGRQKGLKDHELEYIDQGMLNYALRTQDICNSDYEYPGTGAAGGLGFALMYYLNASLKPGFDTIAKMVKLEDYIKECDCVFVGEGMMDVSTQYGKVPYGVLKLAKVYNKKVYAFAGVIKDYDLLYSLGFDGLYEISAGIEINEALNNGQYYLVNKVLEKIKEIEEDVQSR